MWKLFKEKIIELYSELEYLNDNTATKELLIKAAKEAWETLNIELLNDLINKIPKKVDAVILAEG